MYAVLKAFYVRRMLACVLSTPRIITPAQITKVIIAAAKYE
jgi:hypothetical protein